VGEEAGAEARARSRRPWRLAICRERGCEGGSRGVEWRCGSCGAEEVVVVVNVDARCGGRLLRMCAAAAMSARRRVCLRLSRGIGCRRDRWLEFFVAIAMSVTTTRAPLLNKIVIVKKKEAIDYYFSFSLIIIY
jgi:hypothetical protein